MKWVRFDLKMFYFYICYFCMLFPAKFYAILNTSFGGGYSFYFVFETGQPLQNSHYNVN